MEKLELDVQIDAGQYYHFNLYHCYHSFQGWMSVILGIACIAYGIAFCQYLDTAKVVVFILLGIMFFVYNPIALYARSKARFLKNAVLKNPVTYSFSPSGIMLKQGEVQEEMLWENIYKIVKTKNLMVFYLTKYHANIIPLQSMGDKYDDICSLLLKYADKRTLKFKI